MFLKELGLPLPVPGDLLVIGAAIISTRNAPGPALTLLAILAVGVAGGAAQFLLVQGPGRWLVLGALARIGVDGDRLERVAAPLRRTGARGVAAARVTPGVRTVVIPASALAAMSFAPFIGGLAAGNTLFVGGHFVAGLLVGDAALEIVARLGAAVAIGIALLAAAGLLAWIALTRRRHVAHHALDDAEESMASWADAACPACIALAVVRKVGRREGRT